MAKSGRARATSGQRVDGRGCAVLIVGTLLGPDETAGAELRDSAATGGESGNGAGVRSVGEHVDRIVQTLAAHGITADAQVTLRRKHATRAARAAANAGVHLVIASGGDATVSAVARGLVGTKSMLGIVPLGFGDAGGEIAAALGVPEDLAAACALLATGAARAIDVGQVTAAGGKKPRLFFGRGTVGATAVMMPAELDVTTHWWGGPVKSQPVAAHLAPTATKVRLDKSEPARRATTLLVEIENAPHCTTRAPGHPGHPGHNDDDEVSAMRTSTADPALDVRIYHDMDHVDLAARYVALSAGRQPKDTRVECARARRVDVHTDTAMCVTVDSQVVGTTPARFDLLPGALLVAAGGTVARSVASVGAGGQAPLGGGGAPDPDHAARPGGRS